MISKKFKYAVFHHGNITLLTEKPKEVPGGYMTKHGKRFISKRVEVLPRWLWRYHGKELTSMWQLKKFIRGH